MEDESSEFIAAMLHSGTVAHFMHLSTDSFSVHQALNTYYTEIIDLVDGGQWPVDVPIPNDADWGRLFEPLP